MSKDSATMSWPGSLQFIISLLWCVMCRVQWWSSAYRLSPIDSAYKVDPLLLHFDNQVPSRALHIQHLLARSSDLIIQTPTEQNVHCECPNFFSILIRLSPFFSNELGHKHLGRWAFRIAIHQKPSYLRHTTVRADRVIERVTILQRRYRYT